MAILGIVPAVGQIPDYYAEPENGGELTDTLMLTFIEPMQSQINISFAGNGGVGFTTEWIMFPGVPRMLLECIPNGTLPANATVTYTLNPGGTGFTTETGHVLPTSSGTFTVAGGGGDGTYAPACPEVDPPPLTFPKSLAVCGTNFLVWDYAAAYPLASGAGYVVGGSATVGSGASGSLESVVHLDAQGRFVSGIMAVEPGTELDLPSDAATLRASLAQAGTDVIAVGAYQAGTLAPIYERGISFPGGDTEVVHLPDGRAALVQNADTTINVVMLTSSGTVEWAKRYASASFGAADSGGLPGLGGSQFVTLNAMPTGHLLVVNQTKTSLDGSTVTFANTNILARLAEGGAIQWAKKYTGIEGVSAATLSASQDGKLILQGTRIVMVGEEDASYSSILIRLDANGSPLWGKELGGVSLFVSSELPNGKLLLVGSSIDAQGDSHQSLFGLMNASGDLERQVSIQSGEAVFGYGVAAQDRIVYSLSTGDNAGNATNAIVGSSSLQLDDWHWRRFTKSAEDAFAVPRPGSNASVFSYWDEAARAAGVVLLDASLQAGASCALFTDATVEVVPATLVASNVTITVTADNVGVTDYTPETTTASIPLQFFTVAETNLCDGGSGGEPMPVTLLLRLQGTSDVVLEFDSMGDFNYLLQRSSTLNPLDWQEVETVPGNGTRISRTFGTSASKSYWRVITAAP